MTFDHKRAVLFSSKVTLRVLISVIHSSAKATMGTSDEIREVALTLAQDNLDDDAAEEAVSQAMWLIKETVAREELSGPLGLEVGKSSLFCVANFFASSQNHAHMSFTIRERGGIRQRYGRSMALLRDDGAIYACWGFGMCSRGGFGT